MRVWFGFRLPVPWPDETWFIAQAYAFARHGTMFVAQLNPDRIEMWMPPGYMLALAGVFYTAGYGFGAARWVSAIGGLGVLSCGGYIVFRLTGNSGYGWRRQLGLWMLAIAVASPAALLSWNIARMEAMFAAATLLALLAAVRGRPYIALAITCATAVIHFNAVYFVVPALAYPVHARLADKRLPRLRAADGAVWVISFGVILAYAIFVFMQWSGFVDDMRMQFGAKFSGAGREPVQSLWHFWVGCIVVAGILWRGGRIVVDEAALAGLWGCGFIAMADNGHEIWYQYGQALGAALIAAAAAAASRPSAAPHLYAATCLAVALTLFSASEVAPAAQDMFRRVTGAGAWRLGPALFPPAEIAKVRSWIATIPPGTTVNFGAPGLEPMFFEDLDRVGARWTILSHSMNSITPLNRWEWSVRCSSHDIPPMLRMFDFAHARQDVPVGAGKCDIFREGDGRDKAER